MDLSPEGLITYQDVKSVMCNAITESEWQEIAVVGGKRDLSEMPELTFDEFVSLMEQTDAGPSWVLHGEKDADVVVGRCGLASKQQEVHFVSMLYMFPSPK